MMARRSSFVVHRYQEAAMQLDRQTLQQEIHALYRAEHATMGEHGTLDRLEQARQWDLSSTVRAGGVLVFPHAGVLDCGHQIAAVVHACLDSGADRVIVVSVLHAFTDEMEDARVRVAAGAAPAHWPFWGIQGPGLSDREEWRGDHALMSFRHFWAAETARRGIRGRRSSRLTLTWPVAIRNGCLALIALRAWPKMQ